ncbi:class A beta-lactamase [Sphingomonas donggukensis]|uniref:Beta-lactamase n=1 Tax=Sphingomonas donggukensis TaxID=2949093 RepID=A0ABY4TSE8_9SPHN|nr:class A beta-lactamase [Sphingomonas donggukensis]URW74740.1 class A beta-lactamase [Sphingomonas donggukensis]
MDRRDTLKLIGGSAAFALTGPALAMPRNPATFGNPAFAAAIARAEQRTGGRLGVAILDLATGARFAHRGDERFPMCSTFKFLLSAAVLHAADKGRLRLDRAVAIPRGPLPANSPAVKPMAGRTMSVAALCRATVTQSDNAAANLLLPLIGGVDGYNAFARLLGDRVTRLDRIEPELNTAVHGDARDTTSPDAMLDSMNAALFGPVLTPRSRAQATAWLVANTTGGARLRAGLPRTWRVGDKTGTGENGSANDIGVLWPTPDRRPILVTSYLTAAKVDQKHQYAAHAEVARAIAAAVG